MHFHGRKALRDLARVFSVLLTAVLMLSTSQSVAAEAVPGEFVVTLKNPIGIKQLRTLANSKVLRTIPSANAVVVKRTIAEKSTSALAALNSHPDILIAEPNYIYRINGDADEVTPDDPELGKLWGLVNKGQLDANDQAGVAGVDINATKAWAIETGSRDVVVAVIDTGIKTDHPDVKDNLWVNEAEKNGEAGVDDDGNGFVDDIHGYNFVEGDGALIDDHGHGTHVSGTIGARGNDGSGIVGVTWNVRMMGVRFLSATGGTLENAIRSIDYARENGAHIMSNSWGGGGFSEQLKASIERANEAGILFVAAAGNEANNNDTRATYPASYDNANVLSVAAIDNRGQLAGFSNWGKTKVHVGAPGVQIVSSTLNGLEPYSGTSMACPHVSGIAALLLSKFPDMTTADIKKRIISTARPLASLRGKVASDGMADAYHALSNTLPPPDPNDPTLWDNMAIQVSTPHPYENNFKQDYVVGFPGAKKIAVYFSKFELENIFDKVTILDKSGKVVAEMYGTKSDSWSPVVVGDEMTLRFTSDRSIVKYGFDVEKIAFKLTDD